MSILTFSSQPKKNVPTVATLNKSEIMSIPSISADSHWGVSSNIKNVIVVYSSEGKQKKLLKFDFEELSPQATISFSNKARDSWSISDIILLDYDGGQTQIRNGSLDVPALPLDFSGSVASPTPTITSFTKEYIDIEEEGPAVIFGPIVILTVDASNSDGSEVQSVKWYGGFTSTPTTVAAVEAGTYLSDSPSKLEIYGQQAKDLNDKFFAVVVESHGQKVFATNAPS